VRPDQPRGRRIVFASNGALRFSLANLPEHRDRLVDIHVGPSVRWQEYATSPPFSIGRRFRHRTARPTRRAKSRSRSRSRARRSTARSGWRWQSVSRISRACGACTRNGRRFFGCEPGTAEAALADNIWAQASAGRGRVGRASRGSRVGRASRGSIAPCREVEQGIAEEWIRLPRLVYPADQAYA
jgi:hypothetical protein